MNLLNSIRWYFEERRIIRRIGKTPFSDWMIQSGGGLTRDDHHYFAIDTLLDESLWVRIWPRDRKKPDPYSNLKFMFRMGDD